MVRCELEEGVLTLTIDRPEKRNALSSQVLEGLAAGLAEAELDANARVVVIRGAGKDFCAGADLAELLESADRSVEENEQDALRLGELFIAMRHLPKPVVALVRGRALAGGAGLATACDLVLAAESARFGYPEIERGFVPAMVMTMLRRAVGEKQAFDLVATGRIVTAAEAMAIGLVSRVIPDDDFEAATQEIIAALASRPVTAAALTKQLFVDLDGRSFRDSVMLGARVNALSRTTPEFRMAIASFLER
ncbi:MAG: enoyl-CoA hydratase/isomerase family protein [Gemmatimonadales bacterium]|nr:enoyl-CoA hydratase/isomerase family protein [Gemmatimonadales bacterium]MDZ4389100.1 enoyl-CoA hydratase/isomerase family protein [Gemmatimonadales bacterium]